MLCKRKIEYLAILFIYTVLGFCPITLLKVVLVYFNSECFIAYVITCLHWSCLVELLNNVIYAFLGCDNPPKWCSISCYVFDGFLRSKLRFHWKFARCFRQVGLVEMDSWTTWDWSFSRFLGCLNCVLDLVCVEFRRFQIASIEMHFWLIYLLTFSSENLVKQKILLWLKGRFLCCWFCKWFSLAQIAVKFRFW